ncbi:MAG: hypothetical protein B7X39_12020 [Lysobacterales bacterium 14-68-21]|jgi:hypothetical protein|nr:MAG: hypothetical protein B7X45_09765 [Xanthomonadales bacterium 15-68-25]OZB65633.1 MAG: hypothetical protein B7X39_12020 [Xanthomonadales bacterium 14-68-21]
MTDLYLDTAITDTEISYIARVCAESPYSEKELERIMFAEVWPAFSQNLLSFAGDWAGWKEEFVQQRVLQCYKRRIYLSWRLNPLKLFLCRDWSVIASQIARARGEAA